MCVLSTARYFTLYAPFLYSFYTHSMAACAAWGRLMLRSPTPTWSLPCDRRRVPEPPLPHAVGVCQTAQRSFGCRVARKHFFPLSSHVGVGDRHAQIAGCVAHGQLPRFCTGSRTLRRGVRFASHSTSGENSKKNIKDRNLPKDKTNLS